MIATFGQQLLPNDSVEGKRAMPESLSRYFSLVAILTFALVFAMGRPLMAGDKEPSASLKGFKVLKVPPDRSSSDKVINLLLPYIGNHPESLEGRPELDLSIRRHESSLIVDLTMSGYLDDSVSGEHYRGIVVRSSKGWELVDLGVKYICWRGVSATGKCL